MNNLDQRARRASRIYESMLRWLYPRAYREKYVPLMAQFFRDQWRAELRSGRRAAMLALLLRSIPDLASSAFREHLSNTSNQMKNIPPQTVSLALFITATLAGLLSCSFSLAQPLVALGLAYFSAAALLLRALSEWKRPDEQLVRSLVYGATIAVIFAFIFPVWGKVKLPVIPWLVIIPLLLNSVVPMLKTALRLKRPRY